MSSTMTTQMIVQKLANRYNFDVEDAMRNLLTKKEINAIEVSKRKADREAKKAKKAAKPKRADTGYILFCKSIRPDISEGLGAKEIISKGAEMWKALEQETRDDWNKKAKQLKTSDITDEETDHKHKKSKRSPTGYQLFASSIRSQIIAEHIHDPKLVMKEQGARWKALLQTERDIWIHKAKCGGMTPEPPI